MRASTGFPPGGREHDKILIACCCAPSMVLNQNISLSNPNLKPQRTTPISLCNSRNKEMFANASIVPCVFLKPKACG